MMLTSKDYFIVAQIWIVGLIINEHMESYGLVLGAGLFGICGAFLAFCESRNKRDGEKGE